MKNGTKIGYNIANNVIKILVKLSLKMRANKISKGFKEAI